MIYTATINTAANTSKDSELRTKLTINQGLLYQYEVYFPPGSSGLTGVRLVVGKHQLYPTSLGEYFFGDNITISFQETALLNFKTNYIDVYTYNSDTQYDHKVQVRLGIISDPDLIQRYIPGQSGQKTVEALKELKAIMDQVSASKIKPGNASLFGLGGE